MGERFSVFGYNIQTFVARSFAIYLILVFLFLSNYLDFYHFLPFINKPFHSVTVFLDKTIANTLVNRKFTHTDFEDSYWTYITALTYFFIAIIAGLIWTITDKGRAKNNFLNYTRVFVRYYLAAILLGYGISKLLGNQFGKPDYAAAIYPFGDFDLYAVFWKFMGASKSYQVFGGVLETLAGVLFLFRRTLTAGALLAFAVLTNVLMLDIAYDTMVKIRVCYFLLLSVFIMAPDIGGLFRFFVYKEPVMLSEAPALFKNKNYRWIHFGLKTCVIFLILFVIFRKNNWVYAKYHYPQFGNISGIYKIKDFYLSNKLGDSLSWKKLAVNRYFPIAAVQLANDSIVAFNFKVDTNQKLITFIHANSPEPVCTLHYMNSKNNDWIFNGISKKDSVHFAAKKLTGELNIEKGYGKMIWARD